MFVLYSISSGLEFGAVNHTSLYQCSELKVFKNIKFTTATGFEPKTTKFVNEHSTTWSNWLNDWAVFCTYLR